MKKLSLFVCGLLMLIISGCTHAAQEYAQQDNMSRVTTDNFNPLSKSSAPMAPPSQAIMAESAGATGRKMAYTTELSISVDDTQSALELVQEITKKHQGYMLNLNNNRITLKIPVANSEKALAEIEKLGTVTSRRYTGQDLTEQITDLDIRIDNLQKLRTRLTELMKRGDKVADLLKIEQELARITTDIEKLQAQLRAAENRVAYVTVTITFNAIAIQPLRGFSTPVHWVNQLGSSTGKMNIPVNDKNKLPFDAKLPSDFVTVYSQTGEQPYELYAISANDCVIKLSRRDNLAGGTLKFWTEVIVRALGEGNNYVITASEAIKTKEKIDASLITAERNIGNNKFKYQILIIEFGKGLFTSSELYLMEFWGPGKAFDEAMPAIEQARNTIDLSIWK